MARGQSRRERALAKLQLAQINCREALNFLGGRRRYRRSVSLPIKNIDQARDHIESIINRIAVTEVLILHGDDLQMSDSTQTGRFDSGFHKSASPRSEGSSGDDASEPTPGAGEGDSPSDDLGGRISFGPGRSESEQSIGESGISPEENFPYGGSDS